MGKSSSKKINNQFEKEYKWFIEKYLFRLLGIVNKHLQSNRVALEQDEANVVQENGTIYFSTSGWRLFKLELGDTKGLNEDNIKLSNRIIQAFFPLSEYKRTGSGRQNASYPDKKERPGEYAVYRNEVYKKAIEKGICYWIVGDSMNNYIEEFMSILEEWSVKTYEGKNVTLGFVINPTKKSSFSCTYGNWLKFMKDDAAAVLTDCIHSVIELDCNCNYLRHISMSEGDRLDHCDLSYRVPLRFTQVIQKCVRGDNVGVFLLNNGDIILAKDGAICFLKRNLQWLNLSYEAFCNSLQPFIDEYHITDFHLIESVFASILDVSFSHTGGIIAIVDTPWENRTDVDLSESGILNPCDNLQVEAPPAEKDNQATRKSFTESVNARKADIQKRLLKRMVIQHLIGGKKFQEIDRKLRSELISLDGACILDNIGNVYSFGAIIQNNSGSSGGGRGAAARKLSSYGMAVKISTDGYIELYINQSIVYAIK